MVELHAVEARLHRVGLPLSAALRCAVASPEDELSSSGDVQQQGLPRGLHCL